MTLESHVRSDLLKLRARLAKQGIPDVAAMDYSKYLQSTLWQNIRDWVLKRDDFYCVICLHKKTPLDEFDVHHRNYDLATLEGKTDNQIVTLCGRCHKKIEFFQGGEKRTSLQQKEIEYQRLINLHRRIVEDGLPLHLNESEKRQRTSYSVAYAGPQSFCEFYTIDSLMYGFTLSFFATHRDKFRLPLPFGADKLRQPSGAKIIDRKTNKSVITVTCSEDLGLLNVSTPFASTVRRHLLKVIAETRYWRVEHQDIQL